MATSGKKPFVMRKIGTDQRTQSVHSAIQAHPARFTDERNERVPPVNCGAAKPPS